MSKPSPPADGSWLPMLRARPSRNTAVRVVENQRNEVRLYVKRKRPNWMVPPVSWIVPFRAEREITLDAVGRLIWEWCDGRCTVEDITERFRDRYRLTFHEARAAVTGYLQLLIRHGLVAIVMQEKP